METAKTLKTRKSVRKYTGELTEEELNAVLAAGEAAPIGMGKFEDMHMTVIRNQDLMHEIDANCAKAFGNPEMIPLYNAPCYILISTPIPDPAQSNIPYSNAACVALNMHLMATDLGIGSCLIWGATMTLCANADLVAKLNLPEGHVPCCGIVIGETSVEFAERDIPEDRIAVSYID